MDEERLLITNLPPLSAEARALFCAGWNEPVDLRAFVTLPGDYRPEIIKAALRWGMQPHQVVV